MAIFRHAGAEALMLAVRDLSVGYGDRLVLRNVNFTARKGESVALLSPNGSGKTTLSRAVSGILRPQRGTISLCGQSIESLRPRERARRATVVPQCGHFPAGLNVRQMVLLGRYQYLS
ncbi:MAG: ABC transporter ATP-binding protein [Desulfovibrio sp.]|jgi:iron complex transport system ATP-binding protein|nr:ABC transporter ATP-binding protein [Desulfovibrio sp.]